MLIFVCDTITEDDEMATYPTAMLFAKEGVSETQLMEK
jgi:hypothetical protein